MTDIPQAIPLKDAADYLNISPEALTRLIQSGKIKAVAYEGGILVVANNGSMQTKEKLIMEQFGALVGVAISIPEASQHYNVPDQTIRDWVKKGYIHIIEDGWPKQINEAEMAYCAQVYHARKADGTLGGAPLLDEDGLPYELMHPELSEYRKSRGT